MLFKRQLSSSQSAQARVSGMAIIREVLSIVLVICCTTFFN